MNSSFVHLTDGACALVKPLRDRFGIDGVILGNLHFPDGHEEKGDLDWERSTPEEFFNLIGDKKQVFTTSCPNLDEFKAFFTPHLKEGKDILFVCISHSLSGTHSFAVKAAEELLVEYPDRKIRIVDSLRYSTSEGLVNVYASKLREEGKSVDEVADWLEENKSCIHQIGIMDDMFFLARSGRISKAKAFFGTMAGIEPMADINENGLSEVVGKGKGKKKSLQANCDYVKALAVNPEDQIMFICHSNRPKEAEYMRSLLAEQVKPKEIIMSTVDQFCGINIGPGLVATFFFGKKASAGLADEKAILAEILK